MTVDDVETLWVLSSFFWDQQLKGNAGNASRRHLVLCVYWSPKRETQDFVFVFCHHFTYNCNENHSVTKVPASQWQTLRRNVHSSRHLSFGSKLFPGNMSHLCRHWNCDISAFCLNSNDSGDQKSSVVM